MADPSTSDNVPTKPWASISRPWLIAAAAAVFLVTFVVGLVIGTFVIGSGGSSSSTSFSSPDNALACSYFWQFEAAPNLPMLVTAAVRNNPGHDSGSLFLGEWLSTFYQQVNSSSITTQQLLSDSKNGTALGIGSICQQLGYGAPGT